MPSESLTEDYLLSLNLYKKGVAIYYVLNKLPRVLKNGKSKMDYITTRSLFPATFKTAVRQKTRWTYGITMQSIGVKDIFTKNKISLAGRYSFYKDVKTKFLNLLPLLGYILAIYIIIAAILGLDPFYTKGSVIYYMAMIVFGITCLRQVVRAYALYHVYGMRSVFFGCLLPPLFPIRLVYGNVINFFAVVNAFKMKLGLGSKKKLREKDELRNKEKKAKAKPKWAKTDHEFLSREQLRQYRRMLGDVLIVQGYINAAQLKDALAHMDKENGESFGAYLIKKGVITEEQMLRCLSHVKHIQFVPNEIVEKLDFENTSRRFDRNMLKRKRILPLTEENGVTIIGICNDTKEDDIKHFEEVNNLKIKRMYMMEEWMQRALSQGEKKKKQLESLALYHEGKISYEQVVLIGKFSSLHETSEEEMMRKMGILAS